MKLTGFIILLALFLIDLIEFILNLINLRYTKQIKERPPKVALEIYGEENFHKSCNYFIDKLKLNLVKDCIEIATFYFLFISGIIQAILHLITEHIGSEILRAITIFVIWGAIFFILELPFKVYNIFNIEKRYGFSTITVGRFIKDIVLESIISLIILSIVLAVFVKLVELTKYWWLLLTLFLILFSLFLTYIYPTVIAPLFNKFEPLKDESLKEDIVKLADRVNLSIDRIFVMDASKRTKHTNAYFTGIGKKKRVVLYDTLLKNHTKEELLGILAHEIGHFKLKHIWKNFIIGNLITVVLLYIGYNLFYIEEIYKGLNFPITISTGIFLLSIIYSPLNFILSPFASSLSRFWEKKADLFAVNLTKDLESYKSALIKLHIDNLSHPYPHPLIVKLYYTHPPLLYRIEYLNRCF